VSVLLSTAGVCWVTPTRMFQLAPIGYNSQNRRTDAARGARLRSLCRPTFMNVAGWPVYDPDGPAE
jgi:hypothetical protein